MNRLSRTRSSVTAQVSKHRTAVLPLVGLLLLGACTSDGNGEGDDFFPDGSVVQITMPTGPGLADKPAPNLPDNRLDELAVTVLAQGSGPVSKVGDTLVVDFVGVRSDDGSEFDSTYGFSPLMVTLGYDLWIEGWERGLLGVQEGQRLQLDVPSELAYGDEGSGTGIGGDKDLTFVFDIRLVVPAADSSEAPVEPGVPLKGRSFESVVKTLVEGEGELLESSDIAVFRYIVFNGDDGTVIADGWTDVPSDDIDILPGLRNGMLDMAVGERRAITVPPEDGFGLEGSPASGIPPETDIIYVVELVGLY